VRELEKCCQGILARRRQRVLHLDLTAMTFVDAAGKRFLAAIHTEGARFLTCGCLMRAVVAEITNAPVPDCRCLERRGNDQTYSNGGTP
jgi:hypothetical protein